MIVVVVVYYGAASGVDGFWLSSFNEPADPVLLMKKNQMARTIPPQQQIPRIAPVIPPAAPPPELTSGSLYSSHLVLLY